MKIAIIEKGHFEVAYTLVSLFDTNINSITVFTNEETMHQLSYLLNGKLDRYTWVIQQRESNRNFIGSIFRHINDHQYDLIFFNTIGGISHVGMYLQNNKFIHASTGGVTISDLYEDYWMKKFIGVGRVNQPQVAVSTVKP